MAKATGLNDSCVLTAAGSQVDGWRWAMAWLTAPLLVVSLAMLFLTEPTRKEMRLSKPSVMESLRELWSYRSRLVALLVGYLMVETAIGAVLVWSAPTFSRGYALQSSRIGALMATALLVSGLVGPLAGGVLGDISQRTGGPRRTTLVLAGLATIAIPAGIFPILHSAQFAGALLIVFLTICLAIGVLGLALFSIVIPNELRGLCISLVVAINIMLAIGCAPVLVSMLSATLGGLSQIGVALAVTCSTSCVLAAGCFVLARPYLPATATGSE